MGGFSRERHTVGVNKGQDIEIVIVQNGLDGAVGTVLGNELVRDVLNNLPTVCQTVTHNRVQLNDGR